MRRPEVFTVDKDVEPELYSTDWPSPSKADKVVDISAICPKLGAECRALLAYFWTPGDIAVVQLIELYSTGRSYREICHREIGNDKLTKLVSAVAVSWGLDAKLLAAIVWIYNPNEEGEL